MYIPRHFEEKDLKETEALIREFGFALLISANNQLPVATHIPLELDVAADGSWTLHGHIARANPQWKGFEATPEVLVVFSGPHTYVSPSWYNHRNVPTWNYRAVHVYGKVRIVEGAELESRLRSLMARYENTHAENPQGYDEIPAKTLEIDLRGLVGFEIKVSRIEAASKLSQNRDAESYESVVKHLNQLDAYDAKRIAAEMEKRKK